MELPKKNITNKYGLDSKAALHSMAKCSLVSRKYSDSDFENKPDILGLPFPSGNWKITAKGKLYLKQLKSTKNENLRNKCIDKIWAFVSGLLSGILIGIIVGYLLFKNNWK